MVRVLVAMMVVLAACAVEQEPITLKPVGPSLEALELAEVATEAIAVEDSEPDVCALAAALPPDDLCSLICEPDALEDALLDAGAQPGRCYLMLCGLSEDVHAQVGVCLY